jgi:hypothetical protein
MSLETIVTNPAVQGLAWAGAGLSFVVLDGVTTWRGLNAGAEEGNPVAKGVVEGAHERFGLAGVLALKATAYVAAASAAWVVINSMAEPYGHLYSLLSALGLAAVGLAASSMNRAVIRKVTARQ